MRSTYCADELLPTYQPQVWLSIWRWSVCTFLGCLPGQDGQWSVEYRSFRWDPADCLTPDKFIWPLFVFRWDPRRSFDAWWVYLAFVCFQMRPRRSFNAPQVYLTLVCFQMGPRRSFDTRWSSSTWVDQRGDGTPNARIHASPAQTPGVTCRGANRPVQSTAATRTW